MSSPTLSTKLRRIAAQARDGERVFTTLAHWIDVDLLRAAFGRLRSGAATGIDGETKAEYAEDLESNLGDLHDSQGQLDQAVPWYEQALAEIEEEVGPEHLEVAKGCTSLARHYSSSGASRKRSPTTAVRWPSRRRSSDRTHRRSPTRCRSATSRAATSSSWSSAAR